MIDPDFITEQQGKPLDPSDVATADRLEKEIDDFLLFNYYAGGFANYFLSEVIHIPVLYEIARRYRAAGWRVGIYPDSEFGYERACLAFHKGVADDEFPSFIPDTSH